MNDFRLQVDKAMNHHNSSLEGGEGDKMEIEKNKIDQRPDLPVAAIEYRWGGIAISSRFFPYFAYHTDLVVGCFRSALPYVYFTRAALLYSMHFLNGVSSEESSFGKRKSEKGAPVVLRAHLFNVLDDCRRLAYILFQAYGRTLI